MCLQGLCLFHSLYLYGVVHDLVRVKVDDGVDGRLGPKGDEAEVARVYRLVVVHDLRLGDVAELQEVGVQLRLAAGGGKVTDKHLLRDAQRATQRAVRR